MELNSGRKVASDDMSTTGPNCQHSAGPVPRSTWDYMANTSRQNVSEPTVVAAELSASNALAPRETSPSEFFKASCEKEASGQLVSRRSFNGSPSVMAHPIENSITAASPAKKSRSSHVPNASLRGHSPPAIGAQSKGVDSRRARASSTPPLRRVPYQQRQKQQQVKLEPKEELGLQEQVSGVNRVIRPGVSALHAQGAPPRSRSGDMRRNCDRCVEKKVRCSGSTPCTMCRRKGITCTFSLKQKPGPKTRPRDISPIEHHQHVRVHLASPRSRSQQRREKLRQYAPPCEKQKQKQQAPQSPPQHPQHPQQQQPQPLQPLQPPLQQPQQPQQEQQHTVVMEDHGERSSSPPGYVPGAYCNIYRGASGTPVPLPVHLQLQLPSPVNNTGEANAAAGREAQGVHHFASSTPATNNAGEADAAAGCSAHGVHFEPSVPVPVFSKSASFTYPLFSSFIPPFSASEDPSNEVGALSLALTPRHRRFSFGMENDSTSAAMFTFFSPPSLFNRGGVESEGRGGRGSGNGYSLQTHSFLDFEPNNQVKESAEALIALRRGHNSQLNAR